MSSLTSANAIIMLGVTTIIPVAAQLQGFSADDIFDSEAVEPTELSMGVDGKLSGGWVPTIKKMGIRLQADSASIEFFEAWFTQQEAAKDVFNAFGEVVLTSVGKSYTMTNGFLSSYAPMPDAKKILQPRKFMISWGSIIPTPV